MDLTLDQLKESAAHIVRKIPASDDRKKKAVDVPSEFLSPLYSCVSVFLSSNIYYLLPIANFIVRGGIFEKSDIEPSRCGTEVVSRAIYQVFSASAEVNVYKISCIAGIASYSFTSQERPRPENETHWRWGA